MLDKHQFVEKRSILLTLLIIVVISIGGLVEIVPLFRIETTIEKVKGMRPYTPLELAGQQLYIRENCNSCHSQQIRPLRDEVERYGHYSLAAESMYDHPFLWGSKRTGPDLAREGGLRDNTWHYLHMLNPRALNPQSRMPNYPWLFEKKTDFKALPAKVAVQQRLGVPFPIMTPEEIEQHAREQAIGIANTLVEKDVKIPLGKRDKEPATREEARDHLAGKEIVALIAYLQKLGSFDPVEPKAPTPNRIRVLKPGIPDDLRPAAPQENPAPAEAPVTTSN